MTDSKYESFNFVHIPKCGGTSFRKLLNQTAHDNNIQAEEIYIVGCNGVPNEKNISQLSEDEVDHINQQSLRVIAGHHKYEDVQKKGIHLKGHPFNYTILRDPISRFISHYNFFHFKLNYHNCKDISLNDLEEVKLRKFVKLYANLHIRFIANVLRPKAVGLDNLVKIALYNLFHEFGAFGVLEYPEESQNWLHHSSPDWLKINESLPMHNKNKIEATIDPERIDIIKEGNLADCEFYSKAKEYLLNKTIKS